MQRIRATLFHPCPAPQPVMRKEEAITTSRPRYGRAVAACGCSTAIRIRVLGPWSTPLTRAQNRIMRIRFSAPKWARSAALGAVLTPLLAACGTGTSSRPPSTSPSITRSTSAKETVVSLYFMRVDTLGVAHRQVPVTATPEVAAMTALLARPSSTEHDARRRRTFRPEPSCSVSRSRRAWP